jgi:hypothetical protein
MARPTPAQVASRNAGKASAKKKVDTFLGKQALVVSTK